MSRAHEPYTKFYELCREIIESVESAKYLGLTVSDDLKWHKQVCSMAIKANATLYLVGRNLHNCPKTTKTMAYTSLVRPKNGVGLLFNCLEKGNRRAARVVNKKSYWKSDVSSAELLQDLGWGH